MDRNLREGVASIIRYYMGSGMKSNKKKQKKVSTCGCSTNNKRKAKQESGFSF